MLAWYAADDALDGAPRVLLGCSHGIVRGEAGCYNITKQIDWEMDRWDSIADLLRGEMGQRSCPIAWCLR